MAGPTQLARVPAPEEIRQVVREVLERPEFAEPTAWRDTLMSLLLALKDWLDRFAAWTEANPTLARILFVLAVLLLVLCLGHLLYLALADALPFRRRASTAVERPPRWEILGGAATNWQDALQLARAKLGEGDARRAIWIAHRVLLGLLDQQGALQFAGWKTNSHYLRECLRSHPWHGIFAELTALYDEAVYGHRQVGHESVQPLLTRLDRLCDVSETVR
jgi:hypothetical protein